MPDFVWIPRDHSRKDRGLCSGAHVVTMTRRPFAVWTYIGPGLRDSTSPPADPGTFVPRQGQTTMHEDCGHDWNWSNDRFYYASRYTEGDVWVFIRFEDEIEHIPDEDWFRQQVGQYVEFRGARRLSRQGRVIGVVEGHVQIQYAGRVIIEPVVDCRMAFQRAD